MEVFWRLVLGHLLGDFTFQTNRIAKWKRENFWGILYHVFFHLITYIFLLILPPIDELISGEKFLGWGFYLNILWINTKIISLNGWSCVFLIFIIHIFEDTWRIWNVEKLGISDSTLNFLWDQFIHIIIIFIFFPMLQSVEITLLPEKIILIGIFFVIITHFSAILIFFLEKDFFKKDFPNTFEKYLPMSERVVLFLFFFIPKFFIIGVVLLISLQIFIHSKLKFSNPSRFNLITGDILTILIGLISRNILF